MLLYEGSSLDTTLEADRHEQDFTRQVAAGDLDGDGLADLLVTVGPEFPESELPATTWLLHGPFADGAFSEAAAARFELAAEPLETQGQHALAADLDGDGSADLLVGNTELPTAEGLPTGGEVRFWFGPHSGTLDTPDWQGRGTAQAEGYGRAAAFGDLDGLAGDELLLSSWSETATLLVGVRP